MLDPLSCRAWKIITNEKKIDPFISRQSLSKLDSKLHPQIPARAHHFDHFSTSFLFSRVLSPGRGAVTFYWLEIIGRMNKRWKAETKARLLVYFSTGSCVLLAHTQMRKISTNAHIFIFLFFRGLTSRRGDLTFNWWGVIGRVDKHWKAMFKKPLLIHSSFDSSVKLTHTKICTSTQVHQKAHMQYIFFSVFCVSL